MLNNILGNRKVIRIRSDINVIFLDDNSRGRIIDISTSGCKIEIFKELFNLNDYRILIRLPERDMTVNCTCLRTEQKNEFFETVLLFKNLSPSSITCISNYIFRKLENLENVICNKLI